MTYQDRSPETFAPPVDAPAALTSTRRTALGWALSLLAGVPLLSGVIPVRAIAANPQGPGRAIVNVVTFEVPPEGMTRFLAISVENSRASVKEPGCISFEVLVPEAEPNSVMLIETYRDEAGYKAHRVTPHFQAFVKGAGEIGAKRTAVVATRYFPA